MPIESEITKSVTDMRGETSLQEPIESGWNLVCLVSLVFLLRIPGKFGPCFCGLRHPEGRDGRGRDIPALCVFVPWW